MLLGGLSLLSRLEKGEGMVRRARKRLLFALEASRELWEGVCGGVFWHCWSTGTLFRFCAVEKFEILVGALATAFWA